MFHDYLTLVTYIFIRMYSKIQLHLITHHRLPFPEEGSSTATEDEEDARARELRKQEVWLKVPPRAQGSDTDSGSETEVKFDDPDTAESTEITDSSEKIAPVVLEPGHLRIESELPDAIPNLPDLIASSPKLSRRSSDSVSETTPSFKSISEVPLSNPVVVVTAPTPTSEHQVPSFDLKPSISPPKNDAFEHLKLEVKQRRDKNKISGEELRTLPRETAQVQMKKYFKSPDTVKIIELKVKPKVSDKVESKDLLKYFGEAKSPPFQKPPRKFVNRSASLCNPDKVAVQRVMIAEKEICPMKVEDVAQPTRPVRRRSFRDSASGKSTPTLSENALDSRMAKEKKLERHGSLKLKSSGKKDKCVIC